MARFSLDQIQSLIPSGDQYLSSLGYQASLGDDGNQIYQTADGQRIHPGQIDEILGGSDFSQAQHQALADNGVIDNSFFTGMSPYMQQKYGRNFTNGKDYFDYLYGGQGEQVGNYYVLPEGLRPDQYTNQPLVNDSPDSKDFGYVKAGLLALAGAGLTGMLPGTESIFGAGGAVTGGTDAAINAGGLDGALGDAVVNGITPGTFGAGAGAGIADAASLASDFAGGAGGGADIAGEIGSAAGGGAVDFTGGAASDLVPSFAGGAGGGEVAGAIGSGISNGNWMTQIEELLAQYGLGKGGALSTGLNVTSGIMGLLNANKINQAAKAGAAMQDPFGAERPQYQRQLAALMADPSSIVNTPGYKAGLDAVQRKMAANGYLGSGNMMTALAEYGGSFFDKEAARLSNLAGASIAPSGGNILVNGAIGASDTTSKALATLGFSAKDIARILQGL